MEVSGTVGVKRVAFGLPTHVTAASTSPVSNGRRMSRLVSIVARTGCEPLRDRQILFLVRLSLKIASLSEEAIFVFGFVSFYYFQSAKQTLPYQGGQRRATLIARFNNVMYPVRPICYAA